VVNKRTFLSAVQKLPSVHALSSDKQLYPLFVSVWITKHNSCQRSTAAWVMN